MDGCGWGTLTARGKASVAERSTLITPAPRLIVTGGTAGGGRTTEPGRAPREPDGKVLRPHQRYIFAGANTSTFFILPASRAEARDPNRYRFASFSGPHTRKSFAKS